MAASTGTLLASELQRLYGPAALSIFYNDRFLPLFPVEGPRGGDSYRFRVETSGNNSAATYSEGDALPVAGQVGWQQASFAWTYFRSVVQITGHAQDSAQGTDQGPEQLDYEMMTGAKALRDLMNTTFMADSATGILGIVDNATTAYGGLSRATYTALQSSVTTVGGALTLPVLNDLYEFLRDNERGARPGLILSPVNQITNYVQLQLQVSTNTNVSLFRKDAGAGASGVDYGYLESGVSFCGIPWLGIPDMVDTEIVMMDVSPGNWSLIEHRPFRVDEMAKTDDSMTFQLSASAALVCRAPRQQGKLETVTA